MRNGSRWSVGSRLLLALSAAMIIPACDDLIVGPPGPGFTVVAPWADPVNLSNRVLTDDENAYGQQAVFTPDGRMHVTYLAYDPVSDGTQVYYTSAAAPYTTWDAPIIISGDGAAATRYPYDGDLQAASDNSVRAAIAENISGYANVSSVVSSTGVVTLTAARPASLVVGMNVYIQTGNNFTNGNFVVTAVGTNTFTVGAGLLTDDTGGYTQWYASRVIHTQNTAAARSTFTESVVRTQLDNQGEMASPKVASRGAVSHVVWTEYNLPGGPSNPMAFFHSHNGSGSFLVTPNLLDTVSSNNTSDELVLLGDTAGNTHLVYYHNNNPDNEERIVYRRIPSSAGNSGSFGVAQPVSDVATENAGSIRSSFNPAILKLDGSNKVYVFWKQYSSGNNGGSTHLYGNVAASGSFTRANAVEISADPNNDGISGFYFTQVCDVDVASDGTVHAVWRVNSTYGRNSLYPVWYRTRSAAGVWADPEVAAWTVESIQSSSLGLADFGAQRGVIVRSSTDGAAHVFYADESLSIDLFHAFKDAGSSTWHNGGNLTRPANLAFYATDGFAFNYVIEAGVTAGGEAWIVYYVDPDGTAEVNGDLVYTQRIAGMWPIGVDINGPMEVRRSGEFWVGQDPAGKLHALWQERIDPFNSQYRYDVIHGMQQ